MVAADLLFYKQQPGSKKLEYFRVESIKGDDIAFCEITNRGAKDPRVTSGAGFLGMVTGMARCHCNAPAAHLVKGETLCNHHAGLKIEKQFEPLRWRRGR